MKFPQKPQPEWSLNDVHEHLEFAVNLEMWTIGYYMTAMYSIKSVSDPMFRLIQSIVYQEMLHSELAANVYNAFQPSRALELGPFIYQKSEGVPHLNFDLDPKAIATYGEPDADLGGLDLPRINTMCLIELPESEPPCLDPARTEYATIGDFYTALRVGMKQHANAVVGDVNQVDYFQKFYSHFSKPKVTKRGREGLEQALTLIDVITEQGEGRCNGGLMIPRDFQNTADDYNPSWSHYLKFKTIRDSMLSGNAPETYAADPHERDTKAQKVLETNFRALLGALEDVFNGKGARGFGALMPMVGANILTCWRSGVIPQYPTSR